MSLLHSPKIVTNGLVLCLDAANRKSYPGSGNIWRDLSGNGNNGTLTNGPTFSSANGGSIVFDGTDDIVLVNNSSSISPSSAITVSAFFKISSYTSNYAPICFKQNNYVSFYEQYSLALASTAIIFAVTGVDRNQKLVTSNLDYRNMFVHMVGVCDTLSDEMKLYVNGNLVGTISFTSTFDISTNPLRIGAMPSSYTGFSNGNIYNVSIYNRALNLQEIQQNFNVTRGRFGI
jgi:hypothetical protein